MRDRLTNRLRQVMTYSLIGLIAWQPVLVQAGALNGQAAALSNVPVNALPIAMGNLSGATTIRTDDSLMIKQTDDRVSLDWSSFDIGKNAVVTFDQPNQSSVALNKIHDASFSQINGTLNANGIVYLINHNGILFGENAMVTVASLIASTLDINYEKWVSDKSYAAAIEAGEAAFNGGTAADAAINLANGAKIITQEGGSVFLIAPSINTEPGSSIRTPGGQALLAAAKDQVFLAASTDPDLRGMLVEVNQGGQINHAGEIIAERGNITLAGLLLNQAGTLTATTSVDANGTIRLLARDSASIGRLDAGLTRDVNDNTVEKQLALGVLLADDRVSSQLVQANPQVPVASNTGSVTFESGSVTQVLADTKSTRTGTDVLQDASGLATKNKGQPVSFVEVMGKTIDVNDGSAIISRGGEVQLVATTNPAGPSAVSGSDSDARITLHSGSLIDVSGMDTAQIEMERNSLKVELRGDELKDSPLQRDDPSIRGKTAYVDIRDTDEIAFADISGYVAKIERPVEERLSSGGIVRIVSEGAVDFQHGATVDISGGAVNYNAGYVRESKLVANGKLIDISDADPELHYDAILQQNEFYNERWDVVESYRSAILNAPQGTYVSGYTEGKDAGKLNITARSLVDVGTVRADVVNSVRQRNSKSMPDGGSVSVDLSRYDGSNFDINLVTEAEYNRYLSTLTDEDATGNSVAISVARFKNSADNWNLKTRGELTLAADATLALDGGGALALRAQHTVVAGDITNHGGDVVLAAAGVNSGDFAALDVLSSARIDTSGHWINDHMLAGGNQGSALLLDAGNIKLNSSGSLMVQKGAELAANGGAWVDTKGNLSAGNGGDISIAPGVFSDPLVALDYQGTATSYSLKKGGTFSLSAAGIDIAEDSDLSAQARRVGLTPGFFQQGGFSVFDMNAQESGIDVAAGTTIQLQAQSYQLKQNATGVASADSLAGLVNVVDARELPANLRAPVDLSLRSNEGGSNNAAQLDGIRIGENARIETLPGARITLQASGGDIDIRGALIARGGSINASVGGKSGNSSFDSSLAIRLHDSSVLDVSATSVKTGVEALGPDRFDYYEAGSINLDASQGYLLGTSGSRLLADGANASRYYYDRASAKWVADSLSLAAGDISLRASEGIVMDTTISASRASAQGKAGTLNLTLSSAARVPDGVEFPVGYSEYPLEIRVGEGQPGVGTELISARDIRQQLNSDPLLQSGVAYVDADRLNAAQLGQINLATDIRNASEPAAQIAFTTGKTLTALQQIQLQSGSIAVNGVDAHVAAPYVSIGSAYNRPQDVKTGGQLPVAGSFTGDADFIDLAGTITFRDAADVALRSRGDIRLRGALEQPGSRATPTGTLLAYGNLDLVASQIYPATEVNYTIDLPSMDSAIHIASSAEGFNDIRNPYSVYSAAGSLQVDADHIVQSGILKAPFGEIKLHGRTDVVLESGSITSVSGEAQTVLFGKVDPDGAWLYPVEPGQPQVIESPTEKRVEITASAIDHQAGAVIDTTGGGELLAYEFVPGRGGSGDVLSYDTLNLGVAGDSFAIVPAYGSEWAPYDISEMQHFPYAIGDTVRFEAAAGLNPDTRYAILPARYALLPGALLITPSSVDITPGLNIKNSLGANVVAGQIGKAATNQYGTLWNAFVVESGARALDRSEYNLYGASRFFDAPGARPQDAGRVSYQAVDALNLDGTLLAKSKGDGIGGRLDIAAENIALVAGRSKNPDRIELVADELAALNVDSILLGGTRSVDATGLHIDVGSAQVAVDSDVNLTVGELILTATDRVTVAENAVVSATRKGATRGGDVHITGDGALLQVSVGDALKVLRSQAPGNTGTVEIKSGANVFGKGSLVLDSTASTRVLGSIDTEGTAAFSSSSLVLGANESDTGMALSQQNLAGLSAREIWLGSLSSIDVVSDFSINASDITLDATSIRSVGDAAVVALFNVSGDLTLMNSTQKTLTSEGGDSALQLIAQNIVLQGNDSDSGTTFVLDGFATTTMETRDALHADGHFALNTGSDVSILSNGIVTSSGSNLSINSAGRLAISGASDAGYDAQSTSAGLASHVDISGTDVTLDTRIRAASGTIDVHAENDIQLGENAVLDVAGIVVDFAGDKVASSGGAIALTAETGNISTTENTLIDVSAPDEAAASGSLSLSASKGVVELLNTPVVNRFAAAHSGSITVDVASANNLVSLLPRITQFGEVQNLRAREGDIQLDQVTQISAGSVNLTADGGSIRVDGVIHAEADRGGNLALYAQKDIQLGSGGKLRATGTGQNADGGKILLSARDGTVQFESGSELEATGQKTGGEIRIFTPRTDVNSNVGLIDEGVKLTGVDSLTVYGMKNYTLSEVNQTVLDSLVLPEATAFMNAVLLRVEQVGGDFANLVGQIGPTFELAPGIDIHSDGDLIVTGDINLAALSAGIDGSDPYLEPVSGQENYRSDWRFGEQQTPGYMLLRADNDIQVNSSISDGFVNTSIWESLYDPSFAALQSNPLQYRSWSFDIVAGADSSSARFANVFENSGSINLAQNTTIRTGTGDISISAGGDILLQDGSSIYTGGYSDYVENDSIGLGYGEQADAGSIDLAQDLYLTSLFAETTDSGWIDNNRVFFSYGGGDVKLSATGNISAAGAPTPHTNWLYRMEQDLVIEIGQPFKRAFWGLDYDNFINGVGALGGGNVNVTAQNNIANLTIAVPTTGMPTGVIAANGSNGNMDQVLVRGGGNIDVSARGDIQSGNYLISDGTLRVTAGGSMDAMSDSAIGTLIAYGDADINLMARDAINISSVVDQNLVPLSIKQNNLLDAKSQRNYALYNASADQLNASSLVGDVVFDPSIGSQGNYLTETVGDAMYHLLPAQLSVTTLEGNIRFNDIVNIEANPDSQLTLYAGNSILADAAGNFVLMSDYAGIMPSIGNALRYAGESNIEEPLMSDLGFVLNDQLRDLPAGEQFNREVLTRNGGSIRLVASSGDIAANQIHGNAGLYLPGQAEVIAGRDIKNVNLKVSHSDTGDVTLVQAGRDIMAATSRGDTGAIDVQGTGAVVNLAGPGTLLVTAGRDINLGASGGIVSTGDKDNSFLPNTGADILVVSGIGSNPDYAAFTERYIQGDDNAGAVGSFLDAAFKNLNLTTENILDITGATIEQNNVPVVAAFASQPLALSQSDAEIRSMSAAQRLFLKLNRTQQIQVARALFTQGNSRQQHVIVYNTLLNEIQRGGEEDSSKHGLIDFDSDRDGFARSFAALSTLFDPVKSWQGDVSLVFSTINTKDGGDVGIVVPGGNVDVGLPVNLPGFNKSPDQLGIITTHAGDLKVAADQSINVNQSRTFALDGNIMMWSSQGDIDAGRGSKTAAGLATPIISVDENGKVVVDLAAAISGSGIRGSKNVQLFAPAGIIDAGDAGIGAGGNLTLAAQQVVGADNIDVGGVSIGVPSSSGVSSSVAAAGSLGAAANSASMGDVVDQAESGADAESQVAFLTVEIIGLGD